MKKQPFTYECSNDKRSWNSEVIIVSYDIHLVHFIIKGLGSKMEGYLHISDRNNWVCFPYLEKASELSRLDDIIWNSEALCRVFESSVDGISLAKGILVISEFIELDVWF